MHFPVTGQGADVLQLRLSGKQRLPSGQLTPCNEMFNENESVCHCQAVSGDFVMKYLESPIK